MCPRGGHTLLTKLVARAALAGGTARLSSRFAPKSQNGLVVAPLRFAPGAIVQVLFFVLRNFCAIGIPAHHGLY